MTDWTAVNAAVAAIAATMNGGVLTTIWLFKRGETAKLEAERKRVSYATLFTLESCVTAVLDLEQIWSQMRRRMMDRNPEQQFFHRFHAKLPLITARGAIVAALDEKHLATEVTAIARRMIAILDEAILAVDQSSHDTDNSILIYADLKRIDDKFAELDSECQSVLQRAKASGSARLQSDFGQLYLDDRRAETTNTADHEGIRTTFHNVPHHTQRFLG